jgi:hypothetical protein
MGNNVSFGHSFCSYTPSASTSDTDYPVTRLYDYEHARRYWKSTVATDSWVKADLGSSKLIKGILINYVNFGSCSIQANATDVWTSPTYNQSVTVAAHNLTGRYQHFVLPNVTLRYVRIFIPTQTPNDGTSVFRMGTLVILTSNLEVAKNPDLGLNESADEVMVTNEFESGNYEDVNLGARIWQIQMEWKSYNRASMTDFGTLNRLNKDANLLFYMNNGDATEAFICRRRTAIEAEWRLPYDNRIPTLTFKEIF